MLARLTLSTLSWVGVGAALLPTLAAPVCAIQGRDGTTFSGDTYYAGVSSTTSTVTIAVGDLVFIVQMQDATINTSNSSSYGDGSTGRGLTSLNSSGRYEFARVSGVSGSTITLSQSLTYTYVNTDATTAKGQSRFQVIRVPQNSSLASGDVTKTSPPAWNGITGGVLVLDVAGNLDMTGVTLDASASGFRGGGGLQDSYSASYSPTIYAADYTQGASPKYQGAVKGEGIAGTPQYVSGPGAPYGNLNLGSSGYPNTLDLGRGAPGNAGGGGSQHNAGGGGGSNAGAGGQGGFSYGRYSATDTGGCKQLTSSSSGTVYYSCGGDGSRDVGGLGGGTVTPAGDRLILGGGGAGDSNDATDSSSTPQASGGNGGGLVFVRAQTISGSGTIKANGQDGLPAGRDGAGGGGAGGTIAVVTGTASLGLTVEAKGGKGGNSGLPLRDGESQGPGGGGGALLLPTGTTVAGFNASTGLAGGVAGVNRITTNNLTNTYGSIAGAGQTSSINFDASNVGLPSACRPVLTVAKSTTTPTRTIGTDTAATYTITVTNAGTSSGATGVGISDPLPAPFTYTAAATTPTYKGGAIGPSSVTGSAMVTGGVTTVNFGISASGFTLPPGGSVALTFNVNLSTAVPGTVYQNPANVSFLDPTRTTATTTVLPGGTYVVGGTVGGSNYAANSTTNEDVTVNPSKLSVTKSFSPASIQAGNTTILTLTVTNPNAAAVSALSITDNVATSMGFPTPMDLRVTANTCGGTTSAAENTTGIFTLTGGSIAASVSCTVTIAFTPWVPPVGTATNTIPAANITGTVNSTAVTAAAPASAALTTTAGNTGGVYVCDPNFYQTRQDPNTLLSNLYLLDLNNLGSGGVAQWSEGFGPALNAMGYNPKDGYFYAVNITPFNTASNTGSPFRLYRLGKSGAVEYANLTNVPTGSTIAGATVDRNGIMYIKKLQQDAIIYRYDLVANAPVTNLTLNSSVFLWDLAVNPSNNQLYGAVTPGGLYIIDPATGIVTTKGTPANLTGTNPIGTLFFNQQGVLYAYQNGGAFGTINLATGAFTQTATASAAAQSDGGSCAFTPAPTVSVLKLGRNVTSNTKFTDSSNPVLVKPQDTVEYCIVYKNVGGLAPNFKLTDNVPAGMDVVLDAYSTGKGIRSSATSAKVGDAATNRRH